MDSVNSALGSHLFWDADYARLDLDTHAAYIIPRVLDYGSWEDVQYIFKYYERWQIRDIICLAPALQARTINFFANYFSLPLETFDAYRNKQRNNWTR